MSGRRVGGGRTMTTFGCPYSLSSRTHSLAPATGSGGRARARARARAVEARAVEARGERLHTLERLKGRDVVRDDGGLGATVVLARGAGGVKGMRAGSGGAGGPRAPALEGWVYHGCESLVALGASGVPDAELDLVVGVVERHGRLQEGRTNGRHLLRVELVLDEPQHQRALSRIAISELRGDTQRKINNNTRGAWNQRRCRAKAAHAVRPHAYQHQLALRHTPCGGPQHVRARRPGASESAQSRRLAIPKFVATRAP